MKLPDKRYTANQEWCGCDKPKWVARFCGEWLKDSELWPNRKSHQSPSYDTKQQAVAACLAYDRLRQSLIREGLRINAKADFYEANRHAESFCHTESLKG